MGVNTWEAGRIAAAQLASLDGLTQDNEPCQEKSIAGQEPTQDKQPRKEKPRAEQELMHEPKKQPCQEPKKETPSRTSPRRHKPKKRPRDYSESPPRVSGKKRRLVPKKEGEITFSWSAQLCITYTHVYVHIALTCRYMYRALQVGCLSLRMNSWL